MGEFKHFKMCTGWIKICRVTRLAWVFLCCCLFLQSPENSYTNWTYLPDLPSRRTPSYIHSYSSHTISSLRVTPVLPLAELEKFVRIVLTILTGLCYLTLLGPISVHATSLRLAKQLIT